MERLDAYVCSLQLALDETPEIFQPVRVNAPLNVFFGVVNDLMLEVLVLESLIGHKRIGVDCAACLHVGANLRLQSMLAAIANNSGTDFAPTFENAEHGGFVFCASLGNPATAFIGVHEAGRATNEGFVYFNLASLAADFADAVILQREAETLQDEPSGLLRDAEIAAHFIRANPVLAVYEHPQRDKPLVEGNSAILKDGAHLDGELFVALLALPTALFGEVVVLFAATLRADRAVGPAERGYLVNADLFV